MQIYKGNGTQSVQLYFPGDVIRADLIKMISASEDVIQVCGDQSLTEGISAGKILAHAPVFGQTRCIDAVMSCMRRQGFGELGEVLFESIAPRFEEVDNRMNLRQLAESSLTDKTLRQAREFSSYVYTKKNIANSIKLIVNSFQEEKEN